MTIDIISIGGGGKNPLNPLSRPIRKHIGDSLRKAINDPSVTSILLYGGKNFSAGADISEFAPSKDPNEDNISSTTEIPSLTDLCTLISTSSTPIIACLSGVALGGGCELALACHYRIATPTTRIGLPEVKIGLIPGAGGTQRLPRLCKDVKWTLGVITTGRMVSMVEAKKVGIIDAILEKDGGDLLDLGKKWASYAALSTGSLHHRTAESQNVLLPGDDKSLNQAHQYCDAVLKRLPPKERGGEAVHAAVQAIRASFDYTKTPSFEDGMKVETELFWDLLLNSAQGRGLRHAFFAERMAQKSSGNRVSSNSSEVATALLTKKGDPLIGVIGAGTMGSGIAVNFLRAGYKVILLDNSSESLERGKKGITKIFQQDVARKRMTPKQVSHILQNRFTTHTDMTSKESQFSNCLLIIEAVFENLQIKQSIFRQLDQTISHPQALLLSNTSTLSIDSITSVLKPSRRPYCAGMHFFSPAHVMKLVEIVKSSDTSPETLTLLQTITTKKIRKVGVTVGNCEGFVGNRMLFPYTSESTFVIQEGGASVPQLDNVISKTFGMAIGPMVMGDLAGNDIGYLIRKGKGLVKDPKTGRPGVNRVEGMRYTDMADDIVAKLGRVGQKAGKGWYDYDAKVGRGRKPIPSKEVAEFIASYSTGSTPYSPEEIIERVFFPLVNEGFKILEENIAQSPSDIDVIYLYGYGWPAWRGGPMHWADKEVGLPHILRRLEEFNQKYPGSTHYVPSELLKKCVALDLTLEEYYARGLNKQSSMSTDQLSKL